MNEPISPGEIDTAIKLIGAVENLDSFGQMLKRNPGVIALICWLLGVLLRELIIYSNIFADWLRKFLRVDVKYGRRKDDQQSED